MTLNRKLIRTSVFIVIIILFGLIVVSVITDITRDGYYLRTNILEQMKDGTSDPEIREIYKQEFEDVELLTNTALEIRYFDIDLNDDKQTDKIVILSSGMHSGSHGDSFEILINTGDGYIKSTGMTIRLFYYDSYGNFAPCGSVYVLESKSDGFRSLEINTEDNIFFLIYENGNYRYTEYDETSYLAAYKNFLHGTGIVKNGVDTYTLEEFAYEYASEKNEVKYAFFDMNGDDIPELHIRTERFYSILTYRDDELVCWREESTYSKPLNTKAILYERFGGAPTHISYNYSVMDYFGKTLLEINFEKYAVNSGEYDTFFFNDVELSEGIWDALTKPYLDIKSDLIKWLDISEEVK